MNIDWINLLSVVAVDTIGNGGSISVTAVDYDRLIFWTASKSKSCTLTNISGDVVQSSILQYRAANANAPSYYIKFIYVPAGASFTMVTSSTSGGPYDNSSYSIYKRSDNAGMNLEWINNLSSNINGVIGNAGSVTLPTVSHDTLILWTAHGSAKTCTITASSGSYTASGQLYYRAPEANAPNRYLKLIYAHEKTGLTISTNSTGGTGYDNSCYTVFVQ